MTVRASSDGVGVDMVAPTLVEEPRIVPVDTLADAPGFGEVVPVGGGAGGALPSFVAHQISRSVLRATWRFADADSARSLRHFVTIESTAAEGKAVVQGAPALANGTVLSDLELSDGTTYHLTATACDPPNPAGGNYLFQFKHGEGGSSVAGSPSTPIFEFDIRTDESGFDLGNDEAETMQVNAVIYIGYPNAKRAVSATTLDTRQPQDFAIASSSFSAGSTGGPASSSSATTLFGLNALAVYGAGAFVVLALISVVAVVTRSRPSSSPRKLQSTTELVPASSTAV